MAPPAPLLRGACLAVLFNACVPQSGAQTQSTSQPVTQQQTAHQYKWRDPGVPPPPTPPAGAHLTYNGGPVISNVKVYVVLWGPNVLASTGQKMPGYYTAVTNSDYFDWLNEYNTTGGGGTNQQIGRGTYAGTFTINPSVTGSTVDDSQISSELDAQISAGHLPQPDGDAMFMTFFPFGTKITQGGGGSCVSGGFCAYHSSFTASANGTAAFYGVMPDMEPDSGCERGCGSLPNPFDNLCVVSSHELIEAVTDCQVGANNLAWYDQANGEIGDICYKETTHEVVQATGGPYYAQVEWSNNANACVPNNPSANDFTVAFSPLTSNIGQGGTDTLTVQTALVAGAPGNISLSLTNLPSGVTGSVQPTSVSPGSSATVTLNASSGATVIVNTPVVVVGTAGSVVHTASSLVTVTQPPPSDFAINLSPSQQGLLAGGNTVFNVTTSVLNGNPGNIALSASGLPSGVTGMFASGTVAAGQGTTLTLSASANASAGTTQFSVLGQSSATSHTANASVVVTLPPPSDFSVSVSPAAATVGTSSSTQVNVSTAIVTGTPGNIALSVSGLPSGVSGSFQNASVSAGSGTTLTLTASSNAALGQSSYTVTGQSSVTSHPANATTVTVSSVPPPTISFSAPVAGATLSGVSAVTLTTTHASANANIQVTLDGSAFGGGTGASFTKSWDTTGTTNGAHTLNAVVTDNGLSGNASVSVTVSNTATATAVVVSPTAGQVVSGSFTLSATGQPAPGANLTRLELYVDTLLAGASVASPTTATVDSTRLTNGAHDLKAIAYDSAGNSGTSAVVSITVGNNGSGADAGGTPDGGTGNPKPQQGCGCGSSGPGPFFAFAWLAGVLLARRSPLRRRRTAQPSAA